MKTKIKNKIIPLLLTLIIAVGLLPVNALAVTPGSPDDLSLRGPIPVSGSASNYRHIRFGGNRWRILDRSARELFLLSDGSVTQSIFSNDFSLNNYFVSSLRVNINNHAASSFSANEQTAIIRNADGDLTYPLSANEASSITYFPGGNADRALGAGQMWWLRSSSNIMHNVAFVTMIEGLGEFSIDRSNAMWNVRPAFRLNLSSVLFTSAASNGIPAATSANLTEATPPSGDMKLTIAHSSQTLTVGAVTSSSRTSGSAVTVNYSGATTSANNFLCAELVSGGTTWRGVIKALTSGSESGTATFNLPVDLTGSYTLRLWNERFNAANTTNYASSPSATTITFANPFITDAALPMGVAGTPYSHDLTVLDAAGPHDWGATGLPAGLTIASDSGVISGTPTAAGSFPVTVTVTAAGVSATKNFTLHVYTLTGAITIPSITIVNNREFSATIYDANGKYTGTFPINIGGITGTITGTASGNNTILTGTLTGVPNVRTQLGIGQWQIRIRAVASPTTTVSNPSFN